MAVFFGAAAIGFGIRALKRRDELLRWLAGGAIMSSFASLNFVLFPSIYTDYVYIGDILRLGFYLMLLVGAAREIRSYWRTLADAAVAEERRRLASDLHDGIGQELILISAQIHRLLKGNSTPKDLDRLSRSAERAVAESRRAIAALSASDETLSDALRHLAEETSRRFGLPVQSELDDVDVHGQLKEMVLRIAREGVMNAVRHGEPSTIRLSLTNGTRLTLSVVDDGRGFDVNQPVDGGYGLQTATEKANAMGAELEVASTPGSGTRLVLVFDG
jgi:signal transduction histidine kinase